MSIISQCLQPIRSVVYVEGNDTRVRGVEICVEILWEIIIDKVRPDKGQPK